MSASNPRVEAIILAGGTSSRMGRDKLALQRAGITLLDTVIESTVDALRVISAESQPIIVGPIVIVGPESDSPPRPGVSWTREHPPGGGPVAAIAAGLDHLGSRDAAVVVLAGDAPAGPEAIPLLHDRLCASDADGVVLVDDDGRRQPLCGIYRKRALEQALASFGDPEGASLHALLDHLRLIDVPDTRGLAEDIDTPLDAHRFGFDD